jgi:hypothetical protein
MACAAGLHEQSAADPPGRCDCRQLSDQQCLCDTRTLVHRVFAPSLGRSTNIYRTDSLASCPDVRSVSSRALMSNGSASGTESVLESGPWADSSCLQIGSYGSGSNRHRSQAGTAIAQRHSSSARVTKGLDTSRLRWLKCAWLGMSKSASDRWAPHDRPKRLEVTDDAQDSTLARSV